jgi:hypothetical protein
VPGTDWAARAADTIDRVVLGIRDNTTGRIQLVARAVVYGLLAAIVGVAAVVLLAILLVRVADIVIPGQVWSAHLTVGGIFILAGLLMWRQRTVKTVKP